MDWINDIKEAVAEGDLLKAMAIANQALEDAPDDRRLRARLLFERGKIHWKTGHRALAANDYAASEALDPEGPASQALEQARRIEAFFNPDLLNP